MINDQLVEIRCPFKVTSKFDPKYVFNCNRVIVKVMPGSAGDGYCPTCKLHFDFEVDRQSNPSSKVTLEKS